MTEPVDTELKRAIDLLSLPGILIDHRLICPGDELSLLDEESRSIASHIARRRRASGACRIIGHRLLARLGYVGCAIPNDTSGVPTWPESVTGSLAHDECIAVAAVARRADVGTIGIDVELADPLSAEVFEVVASPRERVQLCGDRLRGRLLFAAKEAVYKASYQLDRMFLDYADIRVDLADGRAIARNRRDFRLRFCAAAHVVALATIG